MIFDKNIVLITKPRVRERGSLANWDDQLAPYFILFIMSNINFGGKAGNIIKAAGGALGITATGGAVTGGAGVTAAIVAAAPYVAGAALGVAVGYGIYKGIEYLKKK